MIIRQASNGNYYVCRDRGKELHRNWFLIKHNSNGERGSLSIGLISIPKEFVGKKIMFKIVLKKEMKNEER